MTNFRESIFDSHKLAQLRRPTRVEFEAEEPKYRSRLIFKDRHRIVLRNEIRPVDLFCYLCARFGHPLGFFSLMPRGYFKEAFNWHFMLYLPEGSVDILSLNFRTEVYLPRGFVCSAEEFAKELKADFPSHHAGMSKVKAELTKWDSFLNPYAQLWESSQLLIERARALDASVRKSMEDPDSQADAKRFVDVFNVHYPMAIELSGLCLSVRMMCPVMVEAFLNLLLLAFASDETRKNPGLEDTYRLNLDVKIKQLHKICDHFERPVDWSTQACRDFDRLRSRRNDLLHGNVRPAKQRFETVYLWGNSPLFTQVLGPFERALGSKMAAYPLEDAEKDLAVVEAFTTYVMSCMRKDVASEMENIMGSIDLAYDHGRDKLGILFANVHHDVKIDEAF
jgi:hypothetical protein